VTTPDHSARRAAGAARSRREFWRPAPATAAAAWLRVSRAAMACRFAVLLPEQSPAVSAAREALAEADRIEAAWSVFRADSDVSALNRAAGGGARAVTPELAALLSRCQTLAAETAGAFDITATPLSRCWGLLARQGRVPAGDELLAARALVGMDKVRIDAGAEPPTVALQARGVELNLGAIGKGYAVDRVARVLRDRGVRPALVSAGDSSAAAVGSPRGGWLIALRGLDGAFRLRLRHGATGTSGSGEQGLDAGDRRLGHVIDPRTGQPVDGRRRVTVVARDAATADALSTAFLIGGPALAERYVERHDETLVIVSDDTLDRPVIMGRSSGAVVEGS
jgi:thiamine biosynthesis lipoprotein